jgi:hypothetical protein
MVMFMPAPEDGATGCLDLRYFEQEDRDSRRRSGDGAGQIGYFHGRRTRQRARSRRQYALKRFGYRGDDAKICHAFLNSIARTASDNLAAALRPTD